MSDSLRPHESQHARPPCPSPSPGVHSNSRPSNPWCQQAISSSVVPFSSCPQSLPASESFAVSQLFIWGGQSTGASALASVLPKKSQVWSPNCRAVSIYCPGNSAFQEFSPWRFLSASCKPRKTVQTMMFVFVWGHLRISSPLQCWQGLGEGGEGDDRGWDGWMASLTRWMWVWVKSGSWWWTGRPGVLRFMGSQKGGHDWATELNWGMAFHCSFPLLTHDAKDLFLLSSIFYKIYVLAFCPFFYWVISWFVICRSLFVNSH